MEESAGIEPDTSRCALFSSQPQAAKPGSLPGGGGTGESRTPKAVKLTRVRAALRRQSDCRSIERGESRSRPGVDLFGRPRRLPSGPRPRRVDSPEHDSSFISSEVPSRVELACADLQSASFPEPGTRQHPIATLLGDSSGARTPEVGIPSFSAGTPRHVAVAGWLQGKDSNLHLPS